MSLSPEGDLSDEQSRAVAALVREELARRRMSRQRLADEARISISTLEKALSGRRPFTLATTIRLEQALGVGLRHPSPATVPAPPSAGELAPEHLGYYARPAVTWLEGDYLTVRPSFGDKDALYVYRTEMRWDETSSCLCFRESERRDAAFTQDGQVSIPHQSGYLYLVTSRQGQYRLIIVARPAITGEMYGILTTLHVGRGAQLTPVATPIVLVPTARLPDAQCGRINPGHPCYDAYRAYLDRAVNEPYAMFLTGVSGT